MSIGKSGQMAAEYLVNDLQIAIANHREGLRPYNDVRVEREKVIAAIMSSTPSVHSEDFLTVRDEFKMHAPVSIADVLKIVPNFSIYRDTDRAGMWAIMAQLRGEYADAMMEVRRASNTPEGAA